MPNALSLRKTGALEDTSKHDAKCGLFFQDVSGITSLIAGALAQGKHFSLPAVADQRGAPSWANTGRIRAGETKPHFPIRTQTSDFPMTAYQALPVR